MIRYVLLLLVPKSWILCFNSDCQLADKCLRHYAATQAPEDMTQAITMTKDTWNNGNCNKYVSCEPTRVAYGFRHLYDRVLHNNYHPLKNAITDLLRGRSNYYRYNRGELTLTPFEQQQIAQNMADMGYTDKPMFDHYRNELRFF